MSESRVLVIYHSVNGATFNMAQQICHGIEMVDNASAVLRSVAPVSSDCQQTKPAIPKSGAIYASALDLENCDGLIIGSATCFGNMAAAMKYFIDSSIGQWTAGSLVGKPAAVFTSSASMHGGQESTLLSMMLPLLHHGMLLVGLPYTEAALHHTVSGGSPYGAGHVAKTKDGMHSTLLSADETTLCRALGKRVADFAVKLKNN